MRLHFAPNTISIAVAITLEEAGLDYEPVKVDFAASAQSGPDYLAINPKGRVPAVETGSGILTETGAILEYIAALAPAADLMPDDPGQAARVRSVMYYLASTMHVNHAHRMRGHRWADQQSSWDDMAAKVPQTMAQSSAFVDSDCLAGPFVMGTRFSIADPYLFMVCSWLDGDGVAVSDYPKLAEFLAEMEARPSVRAVRSKGMLTL